jgi:hypothetical protein
MASDEIMMQRLVHLTDDAKRNELMIIYMEDLSETGLTAADLGIWQSSRTLGRNLKRTAGPRCKGNQALTLIVLATRTRRAKNLRPARRLSKESRNWPREQLNRQTVTEAYNPP